MLMTNKVGHFRSHSNGLNSALCMQTPITAIELPLQQGLIGIGDGPECDNAAEYTSAALSAL